MLQTLTDTPACRSFYSFLISGFEILGEENSCLYFDMIQVPIFTRDCWIFAHRRTKSLFLVLPFLDACLIPSHPLHTRFLLAPVQVTYTRSFPFWVGRYMQPLYIFIKNIYVYVWVWLYLCTPHICLVPTVTRRGHQIFWSGNYKQIWATMWVPEIEPRSCGKTGTALTCWANSPFPGDVFFSVHS